MQSWTTEFSHDTDDVEYLGRNSRNKFSDGSNPEYAQNNDDIKEKFRSDCDNWRPQSEHAAFGEYTTSENENAIFYGLPVKDVKACLIRNDRSMCDTAGQQ